MVANDKNIFLVMRNKGKYYKIWKNKIASQINMSDVFGQHLLVC